MPTRSKHLLIALLVALFALSAAAPAGASHGQTVYFEASTSLLNPATRAKSFEQMRHLGVRALRVELYWGRVAPAANSATRPNFNAKEPGELRLEPVRPDPRRSQTARLAGPAHGHLAGAPLGHLQPQSAVRHEA